MHKINLVSYMEVKIADKYPYIGHLFSNITESVYMCLETVFSKYIQQFF